MSAFSAAAQDEDGDIISALRADNEMLRQSLQAANYMLVKVARAGALHAQAAECLRETVIRWAARAEQAEEMLEALKPFAVYGRPGSRDVEVGAAITAIAKATGGAARALEGESIPWKLRKAAAELRQLHDQKIELLRARQVLGLECVKLQAQRDELLEALHHIEAIGMTKEDRVALREILQAARDAIAKATGGAPCL